MLQTLIDLIPTVAAAVLRFLWRHARENPVATFLAVLAFVRSFGATVQTGWAGVLFSFGRATRVLEPGFHPRLPILQQIRQTPIRSVTLHLPRQRVTTSDGLVYDVDSTLVYRVDDPIRALTAIDDVQKGCLTLMPLLVQDLLREQTRETLAEKSLLDAELMMRARSALARWGLVVEQTGLSSIAPTHQTAHLTQLSLRIGEQVRMFQECIAKGMDPEAAVLLVAPGTAPTSRARARARERARLRREVHTRPLAPAEVAKGADRVEEALSPP
jgi:regulator of protease activity HflC (stomatin/prohibitin superfamily)